ncbi:tRNA-queuosine alpha-mannosyltransferase domain-containing protein [Oceanobacter kriegii]|uniref:tRNA-queuosine alpha-mannosyltransferase domain-containing protein n=1 Tax=Oceanobacter kriegii TaxID=64972 RepID=UPI000418FA4E|nr:DUF3524 domain-containing protein [Oceanobacter kriegii]
MIKPRILLLSAYRSDSHAYWADWLTTHLDADWRVLELPGRYFRWRIRGNPLSWMSQLDELLAEWTPDHVLATSMVDVATLKGLVPGLAGIPVSCYFHENQFAYPVGEGQHASIDPQMVQLYAALAADEVLFNSEFNRQSFLDGVSALLKKLPDCVPEGVVEDIDYKSRWLPVPVSMPEPELEDQLDVAVEDWRATKDFSGPLILWNHRWEYDKAPERFLAMLKALKQRGVDFRLALLGARPEKTPPALLAIREHFADQVLVDGKVSRQDYWLWLKRADVVVSTAIHEFQGIAMLEASAMGCFPLVPDDLCYREQYPDVCRYPPTVDAEVLAHRLHVVWQQITRPHTPDVGIKTQWQHWLATDIARWLHREAPEPELPEEEVEPDTHATESHSINPGADLLEQMLKEQAGSLSSDSLVPEYGSSDNKTANVISLMAEASSKMPAPEPVVQQSSSVVYGGSGELSDAKSQWQQWMQLV